MSDTKVTTAIRTRDQINKEYTECAMKLGDISYKIKALRDHKANLDIEAGSLIDKMHDLCNEPVEGETKS